MQDATVQGRGSRFEDTPPDDLTVSSYCKLFLCRLQGFAGFSVAGCLQAFFSARFSHRVDKTTSLSKNLPARLTPFARKGVSAWCLVAHAKKDKIMTTNRIKIQRNSLRFKIGQVPVQDALCKARRPCNWRPGQQLISLMIKSRTSSRLL